MTSTPPTDSTRTAGTTGSWRPRAWRAAAWSALAGAVLILAAVVVAWSWTDELPNEIASHWSGSGAPDGFSAPGAFVLVSAAVAVGLLAMFVAIGVVAGAAASTRRIAAAGNVWAGGFAGLLLLTTLGPQRGLTDVSQVTLPDWMIALSLLAPLAPAVVAAALVPGDPALPARVPVAGDAPRAALQDGERAVWLRRATGGPGLTVGTGAILATAVLAVVLQAWAMLVVPVLLAGLFAAIFAFRVRVDASGLTVRSAVGWPGTHVPADEVIGASVVQVSPFAQFGGWGWRVGRGGRVGVVLRSGETLLVERTGGRSLVVTVDDAASGAALLNAVAARAR